MIFTTITSSESIQTRSCCLPIQIPSRINFKPLTCMKTFMLIRNCLIFLGTRKKVQSIMMKTKKCKMKDELNVEIIEDFFSQEVNMHSLKTKKEEIKKAKGLKKNLVKKCISYQVNVDCLFEEGKFMHTMQTIQSFKHHQTE